jgi:hypothetical protein
MAVLDDKNRRAGVIEVHANGNRMEAKGTFTGNLGYHKRDAIIGADGIHGYKETPQESFLEGAITDHRDLDVAALVQLTNATVTLRLNNGKTWIWEDAWYANEGSMTTDEGEIGVRFVSKYPAIEVK